jgi:hypothetical protein
MLLLVLAMIFVVIALTRPGPNRLFRGRYRRHARDKQPSGGRDATAGLRDPTRRF